MSLLVRPHSDVLGTALVMRPDPRGGPIEMKTDDGVVFRVWYRIKLVGQEESHIARLADRVVAGVLVV